MTQPESVKDRAKEYQQKKQLLTLFNLGFTPLILCAVIFLPVSLQLKSWAGILTANSYAIVAVYFIYFSLLMLIFDFPLAFYSGFILEHQYQLSNQTLYAWFKDFLKKATLSFLFSLALLEGLYALIWHYPSSWWIYAWGCYAAVCYIMGKLFPVLIVPLFYKYSKVEQEMLRQRILDLAGRFALPVENVYTLNLSKTTKKANAAFMGMGKTKRVVLSDTLISNFTFDEIETVVAHEIGHFKHHDIWKHLAVGILSSFLAFWIAFAMLQPLAEQFHFDGAQDVASLPLLFLIFYLFSLLLAPIQNGFSRRLEKAADRFALSVCPDREVFVSCMEKLGKLNLADPNPHPLYEWFFYDHPSIPKRIRMAQNEPASK